jgi:hydrogenase maturation protease
LHDFRWDHAIYSGKMIYKDNFPRDICVFLIEAKDLDFGLGLSPEVKAAAERVVQMILQLLAENQSCNDERIAENPARQG